MLYLLILFSVLAPACNAIMDTLKDQFGRSVFKNLDSTFWEANVSYLYHPVKFGVHWDAWHYFKYGWIVSYLAVGFCMSFLPWYYILIPALLWWPVFEGLYSKALRA